METGSGYRAVHPRPLLTFLDVERLTGEDRRRIAASAKSGALPSVVVGRRRLIPRRVIEDLIAGRIPPTPMLPTAPSEEAATDA